MNRKKAKINKKKELPSFLLNLKTNTENAKVFLTSEKSVHHMGPIFFGCHQYHPQPHSLNLGSFHHTQYTASSKENILAGMFLPKSAVEKPCELRKPFHPVIMSRQKVFTDPYPHKCSGTLKVFKPELVSPVIDVGQTESIIETEASREIPLCWIKKVSSGLLQTEFELVPLSDVWERERPLLPYKERIAHIHFPKEFVTVRVIGPPIPASITITKLPSKRKTYCEIDFLLTSKRKSSGRSAEGERKEKVEMELEVTIEEYAPIINEDVSLTEKVEFAGNKESEPAAVTEEDDQEKLNGEENSETSEEIKEKREKSLTFEENKEEDEENPNKEASGMDFPSEEEEEVENPSEEAHKE